jgi:hypothetical protein
MGPTACAEPQCLYRGALYLCWTRITNPANPMAVSIYSYNHRFNFEFSSFIYEKEGLSLVCANEGFFILCPFIPSYTEGGTFKVKSKKWGGGGVGKQ